ncbi:serine O-acetyltransferase [Microbacterium proteolyticum]|uniref:serine O-acetyltransferase n=1 Tax=Microbacterium proteolyticum TaxID=1572644 RepID=UPI0035BF2B9E
MTIYHGVTIGVAGKGRMGVPVIEDDVYLGAGCCILGDVTVGAGAVVGANAVVTSDVRAGATVVGAPAREVSVSV